jgi:hypothetical protein
LSLRLEPKVGDGGVSSAVTLFGPAAERPASQQLYFGDGTDAVAAAVPAF